MGVQVKEFLNEHSFEEIHEMLDKLYSGWAMSAAITTGRDDKIRTLIFFDEPWRPTSAVLRIEDTKHPATKKLPTTFKSSPNEWYR